MSESTTPRQPTPQELAKADALLTQSYAAAGIGSTPQSGVLYHYTTADGLRGILETGRIHASNIDFLNDTSEWQYGLDLLREHFPSIAGNDLPGWADTVFKGLEDRIGGTVYAACFCEEDDLIPQWRGYAAAGSGYSIGFRVGTLSREGKGLLLPVSYGEAKSIERYQGVIQWAIIERKKLLVAGKVDRDDAIDLFITLTTTLMLLVLSTKKSIFAHEREWRLLTVLNDARGLADVLFRSAAGLLVPYVEITLPTTQDKCLDIASVRCGPTMHDQAAENSYSRGKRPLRYTSFRSFVKVSAIAVNFALATPVPGQLGSVDSIPQLGEVAPDFVLRGATRYGVLQNPVRLSDFRGQTVVLAFFSKAFDKG